VAKCRININKEVDKFSTSYFKLIATNFSKMAALGGRLNARFFNGGNKAAKLMVMIFCTKKHL
jgi:hypothetical protein